MSLTNDQLGRIAKISFALFLLSFLGALSFYLVKLPTSPNAAIGAVHALNNHGDITYLTQPQFDTYISLHAAALVFGLVFAFAAITLKKRPRSDPRS